MSIKLHCNGCSNDYDTILAEDEIDAAVCPRCGAFGASVQVTETPEEPVTPPCVTSPVAHPREVENRSEASSRSHEGNRQAPPSKNVTTGNSEGRFFSRVPRKGLFIAAGILVLLIIAGGITWTVMRGPGTSSGVNIVIETETVQTPEKKAEETGKQTESQAPQTPPEKPVPAPASKTVKKTPKASTPNTPNTPWRYRVETPAPKPAPQTPPRAQANNRNPLGKLFDVFQGPAPDVTPPPAPNDARGSGM